MSSIWIITEGEMERNGFRGFLKNIDNRYADKYNKHINVYSLGSGQKGQCSKTKILRHLNSHVDRILSKDSSAVIFVTCDLYPLVKSRDSKYFHHNYESLKELILSSVPEKYRDRVFPAPFKWEIEAYFYAQPEIANKYLRLSKKKAISKHTNPEAINNTAPPSKRIEKIVDGNYK